jgi:hypothetical protein
MSEEHDSEEQARPLSRRAFLDLMSKTVVATAAFTIAQLPAVAGPPSHGPGRGGNHGGAPPPYNPYAPYCAHNPLPPYNPYAPYCIHNPISPYNPHFPYHAAVSCPSHNPYAPYIYQNPVAPYPYV